jgi:hypothetical protein
MTSTHCHTCMLTRGTQVLPVLSFRPLGLPTNVTVLSAALQVQSSDAGGGSIGTISVLVDSVLNRPLSADYASRSFLPLTVPWALGSLWSGVASSPNLASPLQLLVSSLAWPNSGNASVSVLLLPSLSNVAYRTFATLGCTSCALPRLILTLLDHCDPSPCANGGSCRRLANNDYVCACGVGWAGQNCTVDLFVGGCPADTQSGLSWSRAAAGALVTRACPAGSTGTVRRVCCGPVRAGFVDVSRRACYLSEYGSWMLADVSDCESAGLTALLLTTPGLLSPLLGGSLALALQGILSLLVGVLGVADITNTDTLVQRLLLVPSSLVSADLSSLLTSVSAVVASQINLLGAADTLSAPRGPPWPLVTDTIANLALALFAATSPTGLAPGVWTPLFSSVSPWLAVLVFAARPTSVVDFVWTSTIGLLNTPFNVSVPAANFRACGSAVCRIAVAAYPSSTAFVPTLPTVTPVLSVRLNASETITLAAPITFSLGLACLGACLEYTRGLVSASTAINVSLIGGSPMLHTRQGNSTHIFANYTVTNTTTNTNTSYTMLSFIALMPVCVWWDFDTRNWSATGCALVTVGLPSGTVTCRCTHLTNFGVLMTGAPSGHGGGGNGGGGGGGGGVGSSNSASPTHPPFLCGNSSNATSDDDNNITDCSNATGDSGTINDSLGGMVDDRIYASRTERALSLLSTVGCVISMVCLLLLLLVLFYLRNERFVSLHHFVLSQLALALLR